jgi:hypothetical protein
LNRGMLPFRLDLGISAWIHHPQMIDRLPKFAVAEAAGRDCLEEKWWCIQWARLYSSLYQSQVF